jgi:predicted enzyme related to lactoylglutathione lyase
MMRLGGRDVAASAPQQSPPGVPPYWLVHIGCEDIDASLAKVEELGGTKIAGPIDIHMAKIGIVQDPQGAVFALYAGLLEP